jgi:hypothetical protein
MSAPVDGTVFPLLQTVLTDAVSRPDDATMAAGATVTISGSVTKPSRLVIPNLGIDTSVPLPPGIEVSVGFKPLQYSAWGAWGITRLEGNKITGVDYAIAVIGYVTPSGSVPSTGVATYKGDVLGYIRGITLLGNGSLSVDFGTHMFSGDLTNMRWFGDYNEGLPFNDIFVVGAQSGNRLSGSTRAVSAPDNAVALPSSATGFFDGELFGPNAEELGAIWTLTSGNQSAIGYFVAPKN